MAAIVVQNLARHFGEIVAVTDLSFEVERGEIFGCLGHNGAGKTTTVRLMNGVLRPTQGTLLILGLDPARDGGDLRRRTGVLTEAPALDDRLTARENLTVYAHLYETPADSVPARVGELLVDFGLAERSDDKVGGFSKGMKQRLALARALIHHPELVFLDEPTAGLDPMAARDVHNLILRLRDEGKTIFLCTHNLVEAQSLCDRVAVLEHGALLALGTIADLSQRVEGKLELEVEVDLGDMDPALRFISNFAGSQNARSERGVIVCDLGSREDIPALIHGLAQSGARVYRVSPQEPSLEDIYFGLHGEDGAR